MEIMREPVVLSDGYIYEKSAIEEWLARCNDNPRSPCTGLPLLSVELEPCVPAEEAIQDFLARANESNLS